MRHWSLANSLVAPPAACPLLAPFLLSQPTRRPMRIDEIMTRDPACVTPGTTVREAAQLMKREDTGVMPVVDDAAERRLVGVLTDRDIALRIVGEGRNADTRVSEIMSGGRLM